MKQFHVWHSIVLVTIMGSCGVHRMTEGRTRRNIQLVHQLAWEVVALNKNEFQVDTLTDKKLKRKLKKLRAMRVDVYLTGPRAEFENDSVVVFSRYQFFLSQKQIIFDLRKRPDTKLKAKWGSELIKIDDRVFYRKTPMAIS